MQMMGLIERREMARPNRPLTDEGVARVKAILQACGLA
jgi:hypothetical protein